MLDWVELAWLRVGGGGVVEWWSGGTRCSSKRCRVVVLVEVEGLGWLVKELGLL